MEPTDAQIRKFWEKCGFKCLPIRPLLDKKPHPTIRYWLYPDGEEESEPPPIDPNNLSKYAVPYLPADMPYYSSQIRLQRNLSVEIGWICAIDDWDNYKEGETLALALFWALYGALEVEK